MAPKRKRKRIDAPETLPMEIPVIDRDKFLDMLAEALWERIEEKVQQEIDEAVSNLTIS